MSAELPKRAAAVPPKAPGRFPWTDAMFELGSKPTVTGRNGIAVINLRGIEQNQYRPRFPQRYDALVSFEAGWRRPRP
jgi:hypothetical protein